MPKSIAIGWDIVGCELTKVKADIPEGCTPRQALVLFDAALEEQLGGDMGTYKRKFRNKDGVHVMDALFGRDQECHLYWCPEDLDKAKALAQKELDATGED